MSASRTESVGAQIQNALDNDEPSTVALGTYPPRPSWQALGSLTLDL